MAKARSGSEAKVAVGATSVNNLSKRERQAFAMFTEVAIAKGAYGLKGSLSAQGGLKLTMILKPFPTNEKSEKMVEPAVKPAPTPTPKPSTKPQPPKPRPTPTLAPTPKPATTPAPINTPAATIAAGVFHFGAPPAAPPSTRKAAASKAPTTPSSTLMETDFPALPILPRLPPKRVQSRGAEPRPSERPTQEEDDLNMIGYDDPDMIRARENHDIKLIQERASKEQQAVRDQRAVRDRGARYTM